MVYSFASCDCLQSKDEKHFIHNHLTFTVKYHKDLQTDSARIVGFEVMPFRFVFMATHISVCTYSLRHTVMCKISLAIIV